MHTKNDIVLCVVIFRKGSETLVEGIFNLFRFCEETLTSDEEQENM